MRTSAKLVMLLAVLAIYMPVRGEILIYSKTMNCFEATETVSGQWYVYDGLRKGFLILDVEYDQGEIVGINQAVQIEYWKDDEGKWFLQDYHKFGYERIVYNGAVYLVLEESYVDGEISFLMLRGKTKVKNVGLGKDAQAEVPRLLEGSVIEYYDTDYIYKRTCCAKLRLLSHWTRRANDPDIGNQDFGYAEYDIVKEWLTRHKYDDSDQIDGVIDDGDGDEGDEDEGDEDEGDQDDDDDYSFPNGTILF
jgi:hypothetical protein